MKSNIINFPSKLNKDDHSIAEIVRAIDFIENDRFIDAKQLLTKLVDSGVDDAFLFLGYVHSCKPDTNSLLNYESAYFYFEKSIETTYSVEALVGIGLLSISGVLGYFDFKAASDIFSDLEDDGIHLDGYVYWMLGGIYSNKNNGLCNMELAESYFKLGSKLNHVPCLIWYARCIFGKRYWTKAILCMFKAISFKLFYSVIDKQNARLRH